MSVTIPSILTLILSTSTGPELKVTDYTLAYSLYFKDADQSMHEITTYEHDYVAGCLAGDIKRQASSTGLLTR